ncbi:MAG TPA: glycosyltransferase family A protein [Trinickia sp.]
MSAPLVSLLLPTRGRPEQAKRLFESIAKTVSRPDRVEVVLYVDDDDIQSHDLDSDDIAVKRIIGPPQSMGRYNSACLAASVGRIVALANDDMIVRTPGWDQRLLAVDAEFPDGIYLAYGNDLNKKRGLSTFPILSRRTCDLLVEPYPAEYRGAFIDVHIFDIFQRLHHAGYDRTRYLEDVVFEHMHFRIGKSAPDATYLKRGRFDDDATFVALAPRRRDAAKRLVDALRERRPDQFVRRQYREIVPANSVAASVYFARQFLLDSELPLRRRLYLWYWFLGRYAAAHGALRHVLRQA